MSGTVTGPARLAGPPDRLAVIADVHGNVDALDAVLADIDAAGLALVVNLGDHLSGPLAAAETAARLRARPGMIHLRGNHDRYLVEQDPARMAPSDAVARAQIGGDDLAWLRAMPATAWLGDGVFLCHGAPGSDEAYLLETVGPDGALRPANRAEIARRTEGIAAGLILCAHTHTARSVRLPDGRQLVNPGSVGCPAYSDETPVPHVVEARSPDAVYAVLARTVRGWDVTFRHVPYDSGRMVALAARADRPEWARALATGWLTEAR